MKESDLWSVYTQRSFCSQTSTLIQVSCKVGMSCCRITTKKLSKTTLRRLIRRITSMILTSLTRCSARIMIVDNFNTKVARCCIRVKVNRFYLTTPSAIFRKTVTSAALDRHANSQRRCRSCQSQICRPSSQKPFQPLRQSIRKSKQHPPRLTSELRNSNRPACSAFSMRNKQMTYS